MATTSEQRYHLLPESESAGEDDNSIAESGDLHHRDKHARKERWLRFLRFCAVQAAILAAYTGIVFAVVFPSVLHRVQKSSWRPELQCKVKQDQGYWDPYAHHV